MAIDSLFFCFFVLGIVCIVVVAVVCYALVVFGECCWEEGGSGHQSG